MKPRTSVILTVYNEEVHLRESLLSLIKQSDKDLEIVVVDDGSTDSSWQIAKRFPVRLVKQKHLGLGAARNRGAKEAKGEIVIFGDADLIYKKNYVAKLIEPILKGKTSGTFHKDELVKNPNNFWTRCWQINDHLPSERKLPLKIPKYSTFFRAIKRDIFLKVGGFDEIGYLDDRTLYPKIGQKALGVSGAVCWHYNPQNLREVFQEACWHGKSLARDNFWLTLVQFSFANTLRRIILDTISSKESLYPIFKIVYDWGINVGLIQYLLGKTLAK